MDLESVSEHAGELEEAGELAEHVRRRSFFLDDAAAWLNRTTNDDRVVELVRRVRRSLPGDPDFGDPLSTAGEGGPQAAARAADRLMGDRSAASREVSLGALQVWQALTQRVSRAPGTAEATLVFTDLVGFSTWSLQSGDDATLTLLRRVSQAVEPPLLDAGGRIVKRMGDGLMAVFRNPLVAVAAVLQAQEAIATVEVNGHTPRMRVGIHTGRPQRLADDWLGVDVNIAARVMERAIKGGIVVSGPTLERIAPEDLAELGVVAKRARRQVLAPKTTGVPSDLMMYRLKVVDRETPAEG